MPKIIKTLLAIIGIFIVITLIAALIAIILFPSEKIKTMIVDKTSSAVNMPVAVGTIGLSFAGVPTIKVTDIT